MQLTKLTFSANKVYETFDFKEIDAKIVFAAQAAIESPRTFYVFFQRYSYFNLFVSGSILRLASSIAGSTLMFHDTTVDVIDESDLGADIAAAIQAAAVDEFSDPGAHKLTHRKLAQITLRTIGDFANLTTAQRNEIGQVPVWLKQLIEEVVTIYQGQANDLKAIAKGIGIHIAYELLGSREYSIIDRVCKHEYRDFNAYLEKHRQVEVNGRRVSTWYWVSVHSKVEETHFNHALKALDLLLESSPEPASVVWDWVVEGLEKGIHLQLQLFDHLVKECKQLG